MDKAPDPEDLLSDSLQSLYDFTPITYSSAGSLFNYSPSENPNKGHDDPSTVKGRPLVVTLRTPETQAGNWSLHASSIWASSIFLADHISDLALDRHIGIVRQSGSRPLRVLELGAGAGLPGILIAKLFEDVSVVVSDYPDEELVRTLVDNIARNEVSSRCRAIPYAWGSDPSVFRSLAESPTHVSETSSCATDEHCRFDVVIAADTLWNSELHPLFLKTLQLTLNKTSSARIYLVAGLHTGRYTLQKFMDSTVTYGFALEEAMERQVDGSADRRWSVDRAESEDDKERRRWVVWMTLKWAETH